MLFITAMLTTAMSCATQIMVRTRQRRRSTCGAMVIISFALANRWCPDPPARLRWLGRWSRLRGGCGLLLGLKSYAVSISPPVVRASWTRIVSSLPLSITSPPKRPKTLLWLNVRHGLPNISYPNLSHRLRHARQLWRIRQRLR